jgi:hypothetical protein
MFVAYKKGDWVCQCNELNFSSRNVCRKCNTPKEQAIGRIQNKPNNTQPAKQEESKQEEKGECVVCLDKKADHVVAVCGHLAL